MDEIKRRIDSNLARLRQRADELRLKAHLARMEASDEWQALEARLRELESKAEALSGDIAESTRSKLAAAVTALAKDIRAGLEEFAKGL